MRLQLMATYLGVPYQAGLGPDGTEVTLFSPAPPPDELGFTAAAGHWRKQVDVADLGALWQSRPVADYRGEPCLILDDLGDRLHIAYLGRDPARAAQLGYWEIDREVFEVVVERHDVTGLTEERVEYPLDAATFPAPGVRLEEPERGPAAGAPVAGPAAPGAAATGPQPAAHGAGACYGSPMLDRVAAWHGSPDGAHWPDQPPVPAAGPAPGPEDLDLRSGPQAARERRRPGPWTEPWPERETGPEPWTEDEPWSDPWTEEKPGSKPDPDPRPGRRIGRKGRVSPESVFAELLALADIPHAAYAVDEEVPGAMCLVRADGGFEVFTRTENARLEVRFFDDEETAYFYLFGMLAAEAIRSGRLGPRVNGHSNGSARARASSTSRENVSNYLRG